MESERIVTADELYAMSPDERAQVFAQHQLHSLDDLEPAFRARVEDDSRRLLKERGMSDGGR